MDLNRRGFLKWFGVGAGTAAASTVAAATGQTEEKIVEKIVEKEKVVERELTNEEKFDRLIRNMSEYLQSCDMGTPYKRLEVYIYSTHSHLYFDFIPANITGDDFRRFGVELECFPKKLRNFLRYLDNDKYTMTFYEDEPSGSEAVKWRFFNGIRTREIKGYEDVLKFVKEAKLPSLI